MADLNRKKRVRTSHKASVTIMLIDPEALLTADPPDMTSLTTLEVTLWEKVLVLNELDNELFDQLDSDDVVAEEIQHSDGFKKEVHTVLVRTEKLLDALELVPLHLQRLISRLHSRQPPCQFLPVQLSCPNQRLHH